MRKLKYIFLYKDLDKYKIYYNFSDCKPRENHSHLFAIEYFFISDMTTLNRLLNKIKFGPYHHGQGNIFKCDFYTEVAHNYDIKTKTNLTYAHRHHFPLIHINSTIDKMFVMKDGQIFSIEKQKNIFKLTTRKSFTKYINDHDLAQFQIHEY